MHYNTYCFLISLTKPYVLLFMQALWGACWLSFHPFIFNLFILACQYLASCFHCSDWNPGSCTSLPVSRPSGQGFVFLKLNHRRGFFSSLPLKIRCCQHPVKAKSRVWRLILGILLLNRKYVLRWSAHTNLHVLCLALTQFFYCCLL